MASVRIELNSAGLKALLNSDDVRREIERKAKEISKRAGDGYECADAHYTGQRVAVNIYPATREAISDNYEHNTLKRELYR